MPRIDEPFTIPKNRDAMNNLNELFFKIKVHLFDDIPDEVRKRHPKPTVAEINAVNSEIRNILSEERVDPRKRKY